MRDLIDRQKAFDALIFESRIVDGYYTEYERIIKEEDAIEAISMLPSAEPLTEKDYAELRDRFGEYVEFVVRDMVSGEDKRWDNRL